jgi:hypothetical protein
LQNAELKQYRETEAYNNLLFISRKRYPVDQNVTRNNQRNGIYLFLQVNLLSKSNFFSEWVSPKLPLHGMKMASGVDRVDSAFYPSIIRDKKIFKKLIT